MIKWVVRNGGTQMTAEELIGRLIDVTLADRVEKMLENADRPSKRIIQQEDYLKIFGL